MRLSRNIAYSMFVVSVICIIINPENDVAYIAVQIWCGVVVILLAIEEK